MIQLFVLLCLSVASCEFGENLHFEGQRSDPHFEGLSSDPPGRGSEFGPSWGSVRVMYTPGGGSEEYE